MKNPVFRALRKLVTIACSVTLMAGVMVGFQAAPASAVISNVTIDPEDVRAGVLTPITIGFQASQEVEGVVVKIGGVPCAINDWTQTSVECDITLGTPGKADLLLHLYYVGGDEDSLDMLDEITVLGFNPEVTYFDPQSGTIYENHQMTLDGHSFDESTVTIGGKECTDPQTVSSEQITCIVPSFGPSDLGPQDIVVTNGDGGTGTAPSPYEVFRSQPTISGVVPNKGSALATNSVEIQGTNFGPGATVTVGGQSCSNSPTVNPEGTSISCDIPAPGTPGAVGATVTNTDGGTASRNNVFTFVMPPVVSSVNPDRGPATGGTDIEIVGSNFAQGATVSVAGVPCNNVSVSLGGTGITCRTGAYTSAAGMGPVAVKNPDGIEATGANFTYHTAPVIQSVSPEQGPGYGGIELIILATGTDGLPDITIGGEPCAPVTFAGPGGFRCKAPAFTPGQLGQKDVVLTSLDGGTYTYPNGYTAVESVPTITGFTPPSGPQEAGTDLTISGSNFGPGVGVTVGGVDCDDIEIHHNGTQITCKTPAGVAGQAAVIVTNTDGGTVTADDPFVYLSEPTIDTVAPAAGTMEGGTNITITGTDFVDGATVTVGGVACEDVSVDDAETITCTTPAGDPGAAEIVVKNPDDVTTSVSDKFSYISAPTIDEDGVSPSSGNMGGGTTITITGSGFVEGATVTIGLPGLTVPCDDAEVTDGGTKVTCVTTGSGPLPPNMAVDVTVLNPDATLGLGEATATGAFTYVFPPQVTGVSPDSGPAFGGQTVTLTGMRLQPGVTVTFGGVPCTQVQASNDQSTLTCVTGASEDEGLVDLALANPDGGTLTRADSYTYQQSAPTVSGVSPNKGSTAGGTTITIHGSEFGPGALVKVGGAVCKNVTVVSYDRITCVTPAGSAGNAAIEVTNEDEGTVTQEGAFTFETPAPSNTTVKPDQKPVKLKTRGKASGNKFRVTWSKPKDTSAKRPVSRYRLTVQLRGQKRVLILRNLSGKANKTTLTRKQLLRSLRTTRGEVRGTLRFQVKVRAGNAKGYGPVARSSFRMRV